MAPTGCSFRPPAPSGRAPSPKGRWRPPCRPPPFRRPVPSSPVPMVPPAKETPGSAGGMEKPGGATPPPAPPPAGIGCPCGTGAAIGRGSCQSRAARAGLAAGEGALCVCFPHGHGVVGLGGASLPAGPRGARDAVPLQTPPLERGNPGFTVETEVRPGKGVCPPSAHSGDASLCPPVFPLPVGHRLQPGLAVTTRRGPAPPERTRHRGGFR